MRPKTYQNLNPNGRRLVDCRGCHKRVEHHAKGYCHTCYRKLIWKRKEIICSECGRKRYHKAFGLCDACHTRLYHYHNVKIYNIKKEHGIPWEIYKKITKECIICGFSNIVDLHHLDGDKSNINLKNLVGLCPNHHKMLHSYKYFNEIKELLKNKGYNVENIKPSQGRYVNR